MLFLLLRYIPSTFSPFGLVGYCSFIISTFLPTSQDIHLPSVSSKYKAFRSLYDLPYGWSKLELVLESSGKTNKGLTAQPTYATSSFIFSTAACSAIEDAIAGCKAVLEADRKSIHLSFTHKCKVLKSAHPRSKTAWVESSASIFLAWTKDSTEEPSDEGGKDAYRTSRNPTDADEHVDDNWEDHSDAIEGPRQLRRDELKKRKKTDIEDEEQQSVATPSKRLRRKPAKKQNANTSVPKSRKK